MRRRALSWTCAALGLLLGTSDAPAGGPLSFVHRLAPPPPESMAVCNAVAKDRREHVHIFLINGMDPLYLGNLVGVRDYLQQLGFSKTYYGELFHWWWFKNQLRSVSRNDPQARIVVIGFSLGGSMADSLARSLEREGLWIDMLVYVDAKSFTHNFHHLPRNVGRVVNVTSLSELWDGSSLDGAQNVHEGNVWHFGSPTHPKTLEALAVNMAAIATSARPAVLTETTAAAGAAAVDGGPVLQRMTTPPDGQLPAKRDHVR
jgi:hypothetical protein